MQSDEVVWQIINHAHCSYRSRTSEQQNFCRNKYNVTGLCNRSSCPLANSQYATVLEEEGKLYLATKTVERAHKPARLWDRVQLSADYALALEQISCTLQHWQVNIFELEPHDPKAFPTRPKFLVHKNKQRLTKLVQYLIRSRRLNKSSRSELLTMPRREIKLDKRKEAKAEKAARLQTSIEKQLLERLSQGTYSSAYNFTSVKYMDEFAKRTKDSTVSGEVKSFGFA
ncbi:Mak16 MAK16-like protein [Ostreococcus tauri]|uniref:Protein MAK16 homolog n=1 Tax=Ostreococcus tauri TaxID=70448 RepID=A0A1Y5HXL4_OSTTA|nr:Mak16 MAK16-like protein [Ostreococcus tauri]